MSKERRELILPHLEVSEPLCTDTYAGYQVAASPELLSVIRQLEERGAFLPKDPTKLHMTVFYYGSATETHHLLAHDIPGIPLDAIHNEIITLRQACTTILSSSPALATAGLARFGREQPVLALKVVPSYEIIQQRELIALAYDALLNSLGIVNPRDYAIAMRLPPYSFGTSFQPHITLGNVTSL